MDIVVTTPGRLVDHLQSTPGFTLKYLRFLVIDEADRVIENMQNDWLYHVYSHINTGKFKEFTALHYVSTLILRFRAFFFIRMLNLIVKYIFLNFESLYIILLVMKIEAKGG